MRTFTKALTFAALALSLMSCGKEGSDGSNAEQTGIHISYIKDTDTATCPEAKGGIRVETYVDKNGNDVKDADEPALEGATYIDCYKAVYK